MLARTLEPIVYPEDSKATIRITSIKMELRLTHRQQVVDHVPQSEKTVHAWDDIESLIGAVEGPADWSINLDHYLYGTPKRDV